MTGLLAWVTLGTALGCGLCAGVFFAFSAFVMPALGRLPSGQGIAAMQSINRLAVTPAFMTALFGSALPCAGLAVWGVVAWGERSAPWLVAGSVLYLAGAIVVTIAANVPLNDALAASRADGTGAAATAGRARQGRLQAALAGRGRALNAGEPAAAGPIQAYLQLRAAGERPDREAVARPYALGRR
jgi:uncharacterized membrane protein